MGADPLFAPPFFYVDNWVCSLLGGEHRGNHTSLGIKVLPGGQTSLLGASTCCKNWPPHSMYIHISDERVHLYKCLHNVCSSLLYPGMKFCTWVCSFLNKLLPGHESALFTFYLTSYIDAKPRWDTDISKYIPMYIHITLGRYKKSALGSKLCITLTSYYLCK
jgi:hypothetical protein